MNYHLHHRGIYSAPKLQMSRLLANAASDVQIGCARIAGQRIGNKIMCKIVLFRTFYLY